VNSREIAIKALIRSADKFADRLTLDEMGVATKFDLVGADTDWTDLVCCAYDLRQLIKDEAHRDPEKEGI
jgi:hypothetical protein